MQQKKKYVSFHKGKKVFHFLLEMVFESKLIVYRCARINFLGLLPTSAHFDALAKNQLLYDKIALHTYAF